MEIKVSLVFIPLLLLLINYPKQVITNQRKQLAAQDLDPLERDGATSLSVGDGRGIEKRDGGENRTAIRNIPSRIYDKDSFQNETVLSFNGMDGETDEGRKNPFRAKNAFSGLSKLKKLTLSNMVNMTIFPDLSGTNSLEVLRIDRSSLTTIPATICEWSPKLKSLIIKSNRITSIPILEGCTELRLLDLSYNEITFMGDSRVQFFRNQSKLIDLILSHNLITEVTKDSLIGLTSLQVLDLEGNKIRKIHSNSFEPIRQLRDLNLASNHFAHLPTNGLKNLRQIKVFNSPNLKEFPSPDHFPRIQTLALSYSYHCCSYLKLNLDKVTPTGKPNSASDSSDTNSDLTETILWLPNKKSSKNKNPQKAGKTPSPSSSSSESSNPSAPSSNGTNRGSKSSDMIVTNMIWDGGGGGTHNNKNKNNVSGTAATLDTSSLGSTIVGNTSTRPSLSSILDSSLSRDTTESGDIYISSRESDTSYYDIDQVWKNILAGNKDYNLAYNQYIEEYFEDYKNSYAESDNSRSSTNYVRYPIQCLPQPGPFMPCEDLFGWWTLRCGVWLVFLLALLGNGVVVVVLIFGRSKIDVPRFLVCNLAMADFFMGLYLGILAVVDAVTLGEFKAFAVIWQTSAGCQIAGFLGVFSSELSVYTLAVITLERNYAITHAMHLNKRLSLKHATYIMTVGWFFALIMAVLPLFGISDYRKFAVCLPFEVEKDTSSLSYVVSLITLNGVAFFTLMGCYLKMYCAIRGSQAWNSNDTRIAKRMALLVFTDFLCWAPIAFFSATAIAGYNLISLEEAKVFTIFILPLNSCCNPFLYAIFTKKFKKDCVLLCKRIEESRFTRGLGRGRHSSNFSNRQTPVNSNSAADRRSGSLLNTLERKMIQTSSDKDGDNHHARLGHVNSGASNLTSGSGSALGYCKCGHSLVPSSRLAAKLNAKQQQQKMVIEKKSPILPSGSVLSSDNHKSSSSSPNKLMNIASKYFWSSKGPTSAAILSGNHQAVSGGIEHGQHKKSDVGMIINPRLRPLEKVTYRDLLKDKDHNEDQRLISDGDPKRRSGSISSDTNFSSSTKDSFKHLASVPSASTHRTNLTHVHEHGHEHYQKRPLSASQLRSTANPSAHGKRLHSHDSTVSSSTFRTSTTRGSVSSNNSSRGHFHSTATDSTTVPLSRTASSATAPHHRSLEQSLSANSTSCGSSDVILGPMDTPEVKVLRPGLLFNNLNNRNSGDLGNDIEMGHRGSASSSSDGGHRQLIESRISASNEQRLCHECARQEALLAKKKAKNKNKPKRNHVRLDDLELEDKMNRYFKKLTLTHESNLKANSGSASELKKLKNSGSSSKDSTITDHSTSSESDKNKHTNSSGSQVTTVSSLGASGSQSETEDKNINQFFLKCEKQPYIQVNPSSDIDYQRQDQYTDSDQDNDTNYGRGDIYLFVDKDDGESNSRSPSTLSVRTAVAVGGATGGRDSRAGTVTPTDLNDCDNNMTRLIVDDEANGHQVTRSLVDVRKSGNGNKKCQNNLTTQSHVYSSSASASSCQLSSEAKDSVIHTPMAVKKKKPELSIKRKVSSESSLKNSIKNIPALVWKSLSSQNNSSSSAPASRGKVKEWEEEREKKKLSKKETEEPLLC